MDSEETEIYGIPHTPDLSDSLKPKRPAVKDADHAWDIAKGLFDDNEDRVLEAARIRVKADGIDPPLDPQKLAEEGKSHKRNFTTGFMASLIERVIPRFVMRVKASQYLTSSRLPSTIDKATEKTQLFRKVVTEAIRNWKRWNFFLYNLADQNVKFGKTFAAYDTKLEWRPQVFRLDDCAVPDGTLQGDSPDYFAIRRDYSVSEMYDFIRDREAAEGAGWEIDNVVASINDAKPRDADDESTEQEAALDYADLELELIEDESFAKDFNSIATGILYVKEYDGTVSCWVINYEDGKLLFKSESMYESMDDAVQPVCYDIGNGKVYGSNGVGQKVYDLAVNLEKARNNAFDQLSNRGKFFLVVQDPSQLNDVQTVVTDEYIYIGGAQFANSTAALPDNADAFINLDRYTRSLAEEKVGSFLPDGQSSDKTATQTQIDALKEQETQDSRLDYWLTYIGHIVHMMQRRLVDPESSDPVALDVRARLLAEMSEEELQLLANQPPAQTGIDWTESKQNQQIQFLSSKIGNPNWDQHWLERTIASLAIGPELTEEGLLPANDNTKFIEATRQQQDETIGRLAEGIPVLVSPRDNHVVHMQTLSGNKVQNPQTGEERWDGEIYALLAEGNIEGATTALQHYQSHFQNAEQLDALGEYQNIAKDFITDAVEAIREAQQIDAQLQQQAAQAAQGGQPTGQPQPAQS